MSPALLLEEERIQRDMRIIVNQIYTTLNQENELLQVEMIGNENILMVIDPAFRPLKKFSPSRFKDNVNFSFIRNNFINDNRVF